MKRTELLERLDLVEPAISNNNMIPVLMHVWFTKTHVMTFNDSIAISAPCNTDFAGAVPGTLLIDLLKRAKGTETELIPSKDELLIKAGSTKVKLPLLPPSSFVHEMPSLSKDTVAIPAAELIKRIAGCLRSVSDDTSVPDHLGVTLIPNGSELHLFSTNHATLSHARVKTKYSLKSRVVLSTAFCKQLVQLTDGGKSANVKLDIQPTYSLMITDEGVTLFGRLIDVDRPLEFPDMLRASTPKDYQKHLVPFPKNGKLLDIAERAIIVTDSPIDKGSTTITVNDGKMIFLSKSSTAEVRDVALVPGHTNGTINLDCKHIKAGYGDFDKMLLTDNCFIMNKDDCLYLIAQLD